MNCVEGGESYPLPFFVSRRQDRESVLPLFMAAVNPPAEWVTAQTLDPLAEVDLVVLNDDLTEGYPESATPAPPTTVGTSGTDTVKATTTKSKK